VDEGDEHDSKLEESRADLEAEAGLPAGLNGKTVTGGRLNVSDF
jgi:hypothetical protein